MKRPASAVTRKGVQMPVKLIHTRRFDDDRGWFSETYHQSRFGDLGITDLFVQDNHSLSHQAGTIRGIHFQTHPRAQAKLVRCVRGKIVDYAVDLRSGSPTYGRYVQAELSAINGDQLYVPVGFGHAFVTIVPDTEVVYKVSDVYAPETDGGIRWDCPTVDIAWQLPPEGPTVSDKDAALPTLSGWQSPFVYDGIPLQPLSTEN